MMTSFKYWGLGARLSVMTAGSVAVLFFIFTVFLGRQASQQLEEQALQDMKAQVTGIHDTAQMFNSSLNSEVASFTQLFASFLPQPLSVDPQQTAEISGHKVPLLKGGDIPLHENNQFSDDFLARSGAISTLFVRSGDDFVRVATSLRKEDGSRAMGTLLDRNSPSWAKVSKGEVYRGLALLFGKRYITEYQPVKDASGQTIAVLFVGVDISDAWQLMREKVISRHIGQSGQFFVLSNAPGKTWGQYLFDAKREGKTPNWPENISKEVLNQPSGSTSWQSPESGNTALVWTTLPDWKWVIVSEVNKDQLLSDITRMRDSFLVAGAVLVVLFALFFIWLIRRWVSQPLQQVIGLAHLYAGGDLRQSIHTQRHDEIGQLIEGINGIGDGLNTIVQQVRQTAEEISHSTDTLATDSDEIGEQITKQASSVEETSASMGQLATTVARNADNMGTAQGLVEETTQAVHSGGITVKHAVTTMDAIREASQRIADITHVIESIAFQTNILALNAAVEAARAGEHGKGFAVVAQEVRALAARSANAVKEIDQLIADTLEKVSEGHVLSQQTSQSMEDITGHIEHINQLIATISSASQEQSAGIGQVNIAMTQIGESTHINARRIARTEEVAHSLRSQGHHLTELVKLFHIKDSHHPAPPVALSRISESTGSSIK
ncbi:methyl-accepting chemotaxis protein [Mangrovibacter plantisponsor]|nr:methyl-accepting chemotaxis protein [Mangrovibacter plantisponsor]